MSELEAMLEAHEPSLAKHARALHEHGVRAATLHSITEEVIRSIPALGLGANAKRGERSGAMSIAGRRLLRLAEKLKADTR